MKTFKPYLKESLEWCAAILIGHLFCALLSYYFGTEINPETHNLTGWALPTMGLFLATGILRYLFEDKIKSLFN